MSFLSTALLLVVPNSGVQRRNPPVPIGKTSLCWAANVRVCELMTHQTTRSCHHKEVLSHAVSLT